MSGCGKSRKLAGFLVCSWYSPYMLEHARLTPEEIDAARRRRAEGLKLHEIEGNPLTTEDIAMFEMFDREGWTPERRRTYIIAKARHLSAS